MPSFDVVNRVDLQEVDNAVNNTRKAIVNRFDFRKSETEITLDKKAEIIHVVTEDEMKLKAIEDTLVGNLIKRGVDAKALDRRNIEPTSKGHIKRDIGLKAGIPIDTSRAIVKRIKEMKLKVQAAIQDEQVRVTAGKIDDLQLVIQMLKKQEDLGIPMQFVNMQR
jgi:cyclic-di-GMP-binding protein